MGKFDALLKAIGVGVKEFGDDAVKVLEKVDNPELAYSLKGKARKEYFNAIDEVKNLEKSKIPLDQRVPFKIKSDEYGDEFNLISPKAKISAEMRTPETVEQFDPEMISYIGDRPAYINTVESQKGYGKRALSAMEEKLKKQGADSIYLNASPLGGTRGLSQEDAAAKVRKFYQNAGYVPAVDQGTNTLMYKKLAGVLTGAKVGSDQVDMNPLNDIKAGLGYYDKAKEAITKPLARQLNIGNNPKDESYINEGLKTGLDPINYIPGPAGLAAGAVQMMTPSEDEMKKRALMKIRQEGF
jgi:putative intracellular protease/amidase